MKQHRIYKYVARPSNTDKEIKGEENTWLNAEEQRVAWKMTKHRFDTHRKPPTQLNLFETTLLVGRFKFQTSVAKQAGYRSDRAGTLECRT